MTRRSQQRNCWPTGRCAAAVFTPQASLANLDLKLYAADDFTLGSLLSSSLSAVDNVEHVYFSGADSNLRAGRYALEVSSPTAGVFYSLAWLNTSFLLGDMDANGLVDNFDIRAFSELTAD